MSPATQRHEVAVIGAGLSGMCVAATLRRAGIEDFVVLDRAHEVGGTWRDNTYPGCACDIPSVLYSFSFAPHPGWHRYFAEQPEIQAYVRSVLEREQLGEHLRLGCDVRRAEWDGERACWRLWTSTGELCANTLVAGAGPWHEPKLPEIPGLEAFEGRIFHSSRWDHGHDLRGRRVAVIGTGASAVQFIPQIQPLLERLTVFSRTPHWVLPKPDRGVSAAERHLLGALPAASRVARAGVESALELVHGAMRHPGVMRRLQRLGELNLRRGVRDPELRRALTPRYSLGCKRVLMSNDFYPALSAANVHVVPSAAVRAGADWISGPDGERQEIDTIILATGFRILDMPVAGIVHGTDGRSLAEVWQGSPRAYLGTVVAGFPNAFLMLGPNLGINTAATVLMELQARYVVAAVRASRRQPLTVRHEVQATFNAEVDAALVGTVWNADCGSYFIDATGRNGFSYPWSLRDLRRRLRFDPADYTEVSSRGRPTLSASIPESPPV